MEKYNEVIKQLKEVRGLKRAFDIEYDEFLDSVVLNFYNMKAFDRLDNDSSKLWKVFEFICNMNDISYSFIRYGVIELYFK